MRVLAISSFPPHISGGSKATYYFLKILSKNHKITLITYRKSHIKIQNLKERSLYLYGQENVIRGLLFMVFGFLAGLFSIIKDKPDIIYCKNLSSPGIVGYFLSISSRLPLVLHTSGPDVQRLDLRAEQVGWLIKIYFVIMTYLRKKQFNRSTFIIANCKKDLIATSYFKKMQNIRVIYNGVNSIRFSPPSVLEKKKFRKKLGIPDSTFCIVYTGRAAIQKNLQILLEIAEEFKDNIFILVGPKKSEVSPNNTIPSNVRCIGSVNNVNHFLKAADIFILPSQSEGLSNSLLEAMSTGLCCLTFVSGESSIVIIDDFNGYICYSKDEMISRIKELRLDEMKRKKIGLNARNTILQEFNWERSGKAFEKVLLRSVIKNKK